jgi:acetylornithine deacetylase/succinyl-diaminopimelate desuccinylase-like protein
MRGLRFVAGWFVVGVAAGAATPLQEKIRAWRVAGEQATIGEFREFVAIPNVTVDRANIRRNADFIAAMMQRRGIAARLITPPGGAANPVVYGEVNVPGATRTVLFYAHFDGQPVNPQEWAKGWEPFAPKFATGPAEQGGKLVGSWRPGDPIDPQWRLTGRGSADDKAGVMVLLNAYAALRATGAAPTVNLKFLFDGEEEIGSPNLAALIETNREALAADLWLILDGPCHPSGRKTVVFGVRGSARIDLTVFGPKRPLHSGNYGNWAPNPAQTLANLLASMKAEDGRVSIEGFYDDATPLTPREREALAAIPPVEAELKRELGIAEAEVPSRGLYAGFTLPTLNINGLQAANVGALAANIIPSTARATLNLRLVPGNDARRMGDRIVAHIRARGWHVLDRDPTDEERARYPRLIRVDRRSGGVNAQRTPLDLPVAQTVVAAVQATTPEPVVLQPMLGGTLPLIVVEERLRTAILTVPVVNADNNQHAENENVKVQALWDGIETYAALMTLPRWP